MLAMHEHLVDDDLEEQRAQEREELQEERGDEHLAEKAAVFVNRAQEPGDVEAPRKIRKRGAARHQDEAAIPERLEFGACQHFRARHRGALDEDLIAR